MHDHEVRVQSDGTPKDTIITLGSGETLKNVKSFMVHADAGEPCIRLDLELWMPKVDLHALPASVGFECPICLASLMHRCSGETMGS